MHFKMVGFTLVELVLVLVIIGLLSAVAVPRYIEVNSEKQTVEKQTLRDNVKSAFAIAQADTRSSPDIVTLASYVQDPGARPTSVGIELQHHGSAFIVPTYLDSNCTDPTRNTRDVVKCVGDTL
jgi:prepilin-type N-terminal cleavage/methylation domain-containing protein